MKRSEMIFSIQSLLDSIDIAMQDRSNEKTAKMILDRIEKKGMLPPEYETGNWLGLVSGWEKEEVNEWEKEDD